jgi:succinate-semialdehyde dehydrogenase/glutarate-semialdehyde dehydrogenase
MPTSIDPTTGRLLERWALHDAAEVRRRLDASVDAQAAWASTPSAERATHLRRLAAVLRERKGALAARMTAEMGKPIVQAEGEVEKCAWVCEHYADHAATYLAPVEVAAKAARSVVVPRPLGGVLAIMPWNFPLWQVLRFSAPALMAGNAVLMKHAPSTPGCAADIEAACRAAGLPEGLLQDLRVDVATVPDLIADRAVAAVTLTGSDRAGRAVAAVAGRHLKKVVLELGGSDPFLVLPDADLEAAARLGTASRCLNNGQSCIAAKRFIVHDAVADAFVEALVEAFSAQVVGDPADRGTQVGPLARADLRDELAAQVDASVAAGATVRVGGAPLDGPGFFYPPTVLDHVPDGCPAADDELFGPVAAVFRVPDLDAAVARANASRFGLSASVWTRDAAVAAGVSDRLHTGGVFVNDMSYSDPRLPFGGVGDSGYGRELGAAGILEFVNLQTRCFA